MRSCGYGLFGMGQVNPGGKNSGPGTDVPVSYVPEGGGGAPAQQGCPPCPASKSHVPWPFIVGTAAAAGMALYILASWE